MKIPQVFAGHMTKMAAMPIYGKNTLKTFFPGTTVQILIHLCMKHQRLKLFIVCADYGLGLTVTYFTARSKFVTLALTWENVTMMDSLEIVATFDLELSKHSKLNE